MSARWWELSCSACGAWSAGCLLAVRVRGRFARPVTFLCGRVRFARAGTGIRSPHAQDVTGRRGMSPTACDVPGGRGGECPRPRGMSPAEPTG